jgi:hypothetical protein
LQTFGFAQPALSVQIPAGMKLVGLSVPRCSGLPTAANGGTFTCLLPDGIGTSLATSLQVLATTAGSFPVQARLSGRNIGPASTNLAVTAT